MVRVSEPRRPASTSQTKDPAVRPGLSLFATLLLAAFATSFLPLPWSLSSAAFAAWAVVHGVLALRRTLRTGERGLLVPMLVVGVLSASLMLVSTLTVALVWPVQRGWQECRAGALTVEAQEQCDRELRVDLEDYLRERLRLPARG